MSLFDFAKKHLASVIYCTEVGNNLSDGHCPIYGYEKPEWYGADLSHAHLLTCMLTG